MTPRELSWAAGLFEGEGSIRINPATKRNLGHLVCSVVNTDRQIVDFFQTRWPGYMKPATGLRPDQRPAWVWLISSRRAASFLRDIQPYIQSERVRTKARLGLMFQEQKAFGGTGRRLTDEYRQEQWEFFVTMKTLNQRGVAA